MRYHKGVQANILLFLLIFFVFWKTYWLMYKLISPENTVIDIIAGFIFILVMVPATCGLKWCITRLLYQ